jgi:lipoate-protein ligase A
MAEHLQDSWVFLDSGPCTGAENMALDEQLARTQSNDSNVPPVLRLYQWNPWAISLGYHQDLSEIDVSRCNDAGIDVVRRPTGGRAILHAEELTYCVVMPAGRHGILDVYNRISNALVRGFSLFGVKVALQKSQPDFRAEYRKTAAIPCFASSARYEIEWQGRKLVGSAQRRFSGDRDAVLQHGSILCGPAHQRLPDFLSITDQPAIEEVRSVLQRHTVDLATIMGREIDIVKLTDCIQQGFALEWAISFRPGNTPNDERYSAYA